MRIDWRSLGWLVVVAATFFVVDCTSVHTGDDLGYMFADTVHHGGDGVRVTTLAQCFTTQCHHYMTTNGRFLVHLTVMAMLNLVPIWVFRVCNALMFAMLWVLTLHMVGRRRTPLLRASAWLLLLICIPQPGMLLFTLVAYAVNYLWVGVAVLALLLAIRRWRNRWWLLVVAFVVGTLHEGWSLPVCAVLTVGSLMRRVPWAVTLCFVAGTAVEVLAPGNFARLDQGGGIRAFAPHARALGVFGTHSMIGVAALAALGWGIVRPRRFVTFIHTNLPLIAGIVVSMAFAVVTFTAPRQLTCAAVFTVILILRAFSPFPSPRHANWLAATFATLAVALLALMAVMKTTVHTRWTSIGEASRRGDTVLEPSTGDLDATNHWLRRAVAPDPLANCGLQAVGDRYTRLGLQRLRGGKPVKAILPYPSATIISQAGAPSAISFTDGKFSFTPVDVGAYKVAAVPSGVYATMRGFNPPPIETFAADSLTYMIFRAPTATVTASRKF